MKMLIDGRQVDAADGRTMDVVNPVNGQVLDQVPAAGKADIDQALAASKEGFCQWKAVSLMEREAIFQRFYRLLEDTDTKRDIISTLIKESGSSIRNGLFQYQGMPEEFDFRGLQISKSTHRCLLYGRELALTPLEFSILWYLCEKRGQVVSSEELFEAVWGEKYLDSNNTVMSHIARLREKMGEPSRKPKFVKTVWGVGYTIGEK